MIPFVNLAAQQDRLRVDVEAGIARVLAHGQYTLGPEVALLSGARSVYVDIDPITHNLDTARLEAAFFLPKLATLDDEIASRQRLAETYNSALAPLGLPTRRIAGSRQSTWAPYTVRVPNREAVQAKLHQAAIPTVVHYPLRLSRQPAVSDVAAHLPEGDRAANEALSFPMQPYMNAVSRQIVIEAVTQAFED